MKHSSGQFASECVLLAWMVRTDQGYARRRHFVGAAVTESRQGTRLIESQVTATSKIVIERDLAQRHHDAHMP